MGTASYSIHSLSLFSPSPLTMQLLSNTGFSFSSYWLLVTFMNKCLFLDSSSKAIDTNGLHSDSYAHLLSSSLPLVVVTVSFLTLYKLCSLMLPPLMNY